MKKNEKIFSLIKADHRKVEALFAKIEKTTERGAKTREKLYDALRFEITNHSQAEERAIYPFLKQNSITQDIAFESVEEHDVVKFLLEKLDTTDFATKEWGAQAKTLKDVIEHHVEEEEEEMFGQMRRAFSQVELDVLAEEFVRAKESAVGIFREEAASFVAA